MYKSFALFVLLLCFNRTSISASNNTEMEFSRNPVDISNQLESSRADMKGDALLPSTEIFREWDGFKKALNNQYGLQLGIDYQVLYQDASSSSGNGDAASGWLGFFGSWNLVGRDTNHPGKLGFKVENRHSLNTNIQPMALGRATGSAWSTATGWGKFETSVVELWWEQHFIKDNLAFRAGKVLPFSLYDYSRFKNPKTGFLNQMFNVNPSLPFPSFGLGASILARPRNDIYFVGGIHDANGQATTSGFDTFFNDKEYFMVAELGWDPGNLSGEHSHFFDGSDYHITLWHTDARDKVGTPSGQGFTISAEQPIDDNKIFFIRYGYADGSASSVKKMITTGVGFENIFGHKSDLIGVGASWGRNHQELDQYALEAFYRIQITPRFTITPDVQIIQNPIFDPDNDWNSYFGIRGRFNL